MDEVVFSCLNFRAILNNGESFGPEKERERMLDETTVAISLEKLRMVSLRSVVFRDFIRRSLNLFMHTSCYFTFGKEFRSQNRPLHAFSFKGNLELLSLSKFLKGRTKTSSLCDRLFLFL